jgi:hypothetical protein
MSYQEKENLINIFSGITIAVVYSLIIYQRHLNGQFDLTSDYQAWGRVFLVFMGVSIVARIIIYIIFHIINAAVTKEEKMPVSDERDKLIKLKATRNGYHTFTFTFILAFIALAVGWPFYWMFIIFIISGLMAEIVDNSSQLYYHRKGIRNG